MSNEAANNNVVPSPSPLLTPSPLQKEEIDGAKLPVRPFTPANTDADCEAQGSDD